MSRRRRTRSPPFPQRIYSLSIWLLLLCYRLPKIKEYVDKNDPGAMIIPFSGAFEAKMIELDDDARKAYIEETKCTR